MRTQVYSWTWVGGGDVMVALSSPVSFQTTPADDIIKRVETVGKVQPHVRAKLVDLAGNVVPVSTPGEILVAGYLLQKGCVVPVLYCCRCSTYEGRLANGEVGEQVLERRGADCIGDEER